MLLTLFNTASQNTLFLVAISLYVIAAAAALVLMRHHKLCNLATNSLCIVAAVVGATAAIIRIVGPRAPGDLLTYHAAIPQIMVDIKIDQLSAFFILGLSVLVLAVSIYSMGYVSHYYGKRKVGYFNFLYASFILSMFLVMIAGNAIFFYLAWEAMAMISYFLVIFESERDENHRAGKIYLIMTHLGTAFLLIGFMMMYSYTHSFDIFGSAEAIPEIARNLMFIFFLIGFGTKAGVVPLHIWLPYAHPAAPSNVSALMSGIMIKTAIYGMIRFMLCYLQVQAVWWGVVILFIGIVSAVLGVAYALMEHDVKRLLAFHSVENIGIILIGLGVAFIALAQDNQFLGGLGLLAALLHTFNHTLFKGGLFLGAGAIQYATHTKDLEKLGGLIKKMPVTAVWVLCFSLAISAIVPFNGFISEWLIYQALFLNITMGMPALNMISMLSMAALGLAGALAAACFVKLFGISFLGRPRSAAAEKAVEVPRTMNAGMGILGVFCLLIGLLPGFFVKLVDPVVVSLGGTSISGKLKGWLLTAAASSQVSAPKIAPLEIVIVLAGVIVLALVLLRIIGGKYVIRKYGTWDCGFEALNARMQYSATGFSKPIRIVFSILYRPGRKVVVEKGASDYFPAEIKYQVWTEPVFEKYLYDPALGLVRKFSWRIIRLVQTGSVHAYLIYIFVSVLALMLYNRLA